METYYESKDLAKFSDMDKNREPLWDKFIAWYTEATATEGALTKQENP